MTNIADWLREQKLEAHIEAFEREGITVEMLHALSDDDLKQLGMTKIGERRGLQQAAAALRAAAAPPPSAPRGGGLDTVLNHLGGTTDGEQAPPGGVVPNDPMLKVVFGGAGLMLLSMLMPWLEGRSHTSGFGQSFSASGGTLIGLGTVWGYLGAGLAAAAIQQTRKGFRRAWMFGLASFAVVAGQLIDADGSKVSSSFMGASSSVRLAPQFGIAAFALGGLVLTIGAFRLRGERTQAEAYALQGMAGLVGLASVAGLLYSKSVWRLWFLSQGKSNLVSADGVFFLLTSVGGLFGLLWAVPSVAPALGGRVRAMWASERDAVTPSAWRGLSAWLVDVVLGRGMLAWSLAVLLDWCTTRFDVAMLTRALMFAEAGVVIAVLGLLARKLYADLGLRVASLLPAFPAVVGAYVVLTYLYDATLPSAPTEPDALGVFLYTVPIGIAVAFMSWAERRGQATPAEEPQHEGLQGAWRYAGPAVLGIPFAGVFGAVCADWWSNPVTWLTLAWAGYALVVWGRAVVRERQQPPVEAIAVGAAAIAAYFMLVSEDPALGELDRGAPALGAFAGALTLALRTEGLARLAGRVAAPLLAAALLLVPKLPFGSVIVRDVFLRAVAPAGSNVEVASGSLDGAKVVVGGAPFTITREEQRVPAGPNTWTVEHPLAEGPVTLQVTPVPNETLIVDVPMSKGFLQVQYRDAEGQDLQLTPTLASPPPFLLDGKPLAALTKDDQGRYIVTAGTHEVSLQDPEWTRDSEQVTVYAGGTYVANMGLVVREAKLVVPPPSGTVTITSAASSSALPPTTLGGVSYSFAASNLHDGRLDTSWQPKQDGGTPTVRLNFAPTRLAQLRVANGFQATDANGDMFAANRRVARLTVTTSTGWSRSYSLADQRDWVSLPLEDTAPATWVDLRIDATYDNARWPDVALSEVQLVGADETVTATSASTVGASQGLQPPAWIIALGAFPDAAQADAFIATSARQGHGGLSKLWIPDWPSLSGRPLFVVYDGPVPYAEREQARQRMLAAKGWSPGAYAVKIDRSAGREEIRQ